MDPISEQVFELPNACMADCLGMTIVDCEDGINSNGNNNDIADTHKDLTGFSNNSENETFNLQTNGGNHLQKDFSLFPNPAYSDLNIKIESTTATKATISIINYTGKVMNSENYNLSKGINTKQINIENLSSGIYQLQIRSNSEVSTSKFVKM